jgi:hypothetical protein
MAAMDVSAWLTCTKADGSIQKEDVNTTNLTNDIQ